MKWAYGHARRHQLRLVSAAPKRIVKRMRGAAMSELFLNKLTG